MRGLIFSLGIAALCLGGCAKSYRDTTLYQLSGRQKAIVAVLPVIDHSTPNDLTWELSREFTDEIRKKVYDSSSIYLLRDGGGLETAKLLNTPNPNEIPSSALGTLGAAEFVIVSEIIEQEEKSYGVGSGKSDHPFRSEVGAVLSLALRVRVIDVRHSTSKVVLQEILNQDYVIALPYMNCDYDKMHWGTDAFGHTPMGMAHNRLVRELVARTEAYIEASR